MATFIDAARSFGGLITLPGVVVASILIAISSIVNRRLAIRYPSNLPRVREPAGATRFSLKTRLAYHTDCNALFEEAYEKVDKSTMTCRKDWEVEAEVKLIEQTVF